MDYADEEPVLGEHTITLVKIKERITFYVNGEKVIDKTDRVNNEILNADGSSTGKTKDTGPVFGGGRFGLRHMVSLAAQYSDMSIYRLIEN